MGFHIQSLVSPYGRLTYVPGLSFAPFATTGSIGYPPLSAFTFGLTYRLYVLLGEPSRFLYYFLLKQPMILADIGTAVMLAKIILLSRNGRSARTAFLVWLYFPLGIIVSSMWGQLDPISLMLSLLALYYFLTSKWLVSASMLGLSIFLKILPVVFLPVFLIQSNVKSAIRVRYLLVSLTIPLVGTIIPAMVFNWSFKQIYNYGAFQTAIPVSGKMSLLGLFYSFPSLSGIAHYFTPVVWVPVLLGGYIYVRRNDLALVEGLLVAILAFMISRPFLTEQYAVYPLALLLMSRRRQSIGQFLGLALASTVFLVANNTLLIVFFSPIFPWAFQWGQFTWNIFIISQPPIAALRGSIMSVSAVVFFAESVLAILGRESIVYRIAMSAKLLLPIRKPNISTIGLDRV